ncbi:hypothetical protein CYMTET_24141 [Cymbomonas tetramitiformis]|uniref:Uncharacterized protein n=1 Tax=Cymbomonas tetramitiformis TaxID=36881 RepID=A0AAE0FWF4_9CHLO|nr:hypothetical protein CYMTET_24141 [Cymbomonas tetramitiformis]
MGAYPWEPVAGVGLSGTGSGVTGCHEANSLGYWSGGRVSGSYELDQGREARISFTQRGESGLYTPCVVNLAIEEVMKHAIDLLRKGVFGSGFRCSGGFRGAGLHEEQTCLRLGLFAFRGAEGPCRVSWYEIDDAPREIRVGVGNIARCSEMYGQGTSVEDVVEVIADGSQVKAAAGGDMVSQRRFRSVQLGLWQAYPPGDEGTCEEAVAGMTRWWKRGGEKVGGGVKEPAKMGKAVVVRD